MAETNPLSEQSPVRVPVPISELVDPNIGGGDLRLLLLLRLRGDEYKANYRVLAKDLDVHENTIKRRIARLRRAGYIPTSNDGYVYFVAGGGMIKIGFSSDPDKRLRDLRTSSPIPLKLLTTTPGGRDEETALHRRFAEHRRQGEWFTECEEILDYIQGLNSDV